MRNRLLALSLLVIALLWAYSRNRLTQEEHEALRRQKAEKNAQDNLQFMEFLDDYYPDEPRSDEEEKRFQEWLAQQEAADAQEHIFTEANFEIWKAEKSIAL